MPPDFASLFPRLPLSKRAQRLILVHPDQQFEALIAFAETADLALPEAVLETYLQMSEITQARAFRFPRRRESFLLGHLAAKLALCAYFAAPNGSEINLIRGVFGQPLVEYPHPHRAEITLSHSEEFAVALAFPREHPMGIDVETIDPSRAGTVKSELKFSPPEKEWLDSSAGTSSAYVMLWTMREALGKALRTGLTCPLEFLAVDRIKPLASGCWESEYGHFAQYKCLSWLHENRAISIALPRTTELSIGKV